MWRTPLGVRVLRRWEWRLFQRGLRSLYDDLELPATTLPNSGTGIRVFDHLPDASKLTILARVGKALRQRNVSCPDLNALTRGTIAAVYVQIREDIDSEIRMSSDMFPPDYFSVKMRLAVVKAFLQAHPECAIPRQSSASRNYDPELSWVPKPDCDDRKAWISLLDDLVGRVIKVRRGFDVLKRFLDAYPEICQDTQCQTGIDEGYFTLIAAAPSGDELESDHEILRRLSGIRDNWNRGAYRWS